MRGLSKNILVRFIQLVIAGLWMKLDTVQWYEIRCKIILQQA